MSDSSAIEVAIFTTLADATLAALVPDGVWWNAAPQGKTKFVVVSLPTASEEYEQGREAFEIPTYLIKAVAKESSPDTVDAAAARIRVLVEAMKSATGYHLMRVQRIERIKYPDPDPNDPAVQWHHAGGLYEFLAEPV